MDREVEELVEIISPQLAMVNWQMDKMHPEDLKRLRKIAQAILDAGYRKPLKQDPLKFSEPDGNTPLKQESERCVICGKSITDCKVCAECWNNRFKGQESECELCKQGIPHCCGNIKPSENDAFFKACKHICENPKEFIAELDKRIEAHNRRVG